MTAQTDIQRLWDDVAEYLVDKTMGSDEVLAMAVAHGSTLVYFNGGIGAVGDLFDQIYAALERYGDGVRSDH